MVSYQDFVKKARERFDKRQVNARSRYQFTEHSRYKMQQYNLSEQRVTRIIRAPKRTEEGVAEKTIAVMQPGTIKRDAKGKETWTQEIWVMYTTKNYKLRMIDDELKNVNPQSEIRNQQIRIISAWRYPGMSSKRNPIPEEILRELETGETFEDE